MKKILTLVLMAVATMASAQTLIKAEFQKGDTAIYDGNLKIEMAPQGQPAGEATLNIASRFVVREKTADGYIIESTMLKADTDGAKTGNIAIDLMVHSMAMLKDFTVVYAADQNGKVYKVMNMEQVTNHTNDFFSGIVNILYADHPELAQVQPKEEMLATMNAEVTEEKLVEDMNKINSIFSLYGKLLVSGDTKQEVVEGINFNTVYTVNKMLGKVSVIAHSVSDMKEDAVKEMFFKQLEGAGIPAEQMEQMKQSFPMLVAAGLAKVEVVNDATYLFQKNGWVEQLKTTADSETFGTKIKVTTTTGIKYMNRK